MLIMLLDSHKVAPPAPFRDTFRFVLYIRQAWVVMLER